MYYKKMMGTRMLAQTLVSFLNVKFNADFEKIANLINIYSEKNKIKPKHIHHILCKQKELNAWQIKIIFLAAIQHGWLPEDNNEIDAIYKTFFDKKKPNQKEFLDRMTEYLPEQVYLRKLIKALYE